MEKHIIDAQWINNMSFESEINGHKITIDANEEMGGENKGPRPKPLMLLALAGCSGMDVISILKKMKVEPEYFNIKVEGDLSDEYPKQYIKMKVIYEFKGKDLPFDKIEKAVKLSEEKYCGVYALYKKAIEVTNEIKIL